VTQKKNRKCTHPTYVRLWPIIAATFVSPPLADTRLTDTLWAREVNDIALDCSAKLAHGEEPNDAGVDVGQA
jgi:hypothetical protein